MEPGGEQLVDRRWGSFTNDSHKNIEMSFGATALVQPAVRLRPMYHRRSTVHVHAEGTPSAFGQSRPRMVPGEQDRILQRNW